MGSFEISPAKRPLWMIGVIAAATVAAGVAQAQQVGTAAAVNPAAQARGAGGSRTVVIGQSIAHKERIQTTAAGSVQLLFLDKTSMTIGPNSDLAIDEYVYDPATNTGKLAATLSKGVMRFVGGQISHAGNAEITTPNAVVGVRGAVAIFEPNSIYLGYGSASISYHPNGAPAPFNLRMSAGDYVSLIPNPNGGPPIPGPPPPNYLAAVLSSLQSQAGQGGGAAKSAATVNQARATITGSPNGNIASNPPPAGGQFLNQLTQSNTTSQVTQTLQTTATQSSLGQTESAVAESLSGLTAGISRVSVNGNNQPPQNTLIFGTATYQTDPAHGRAQANFQFPNGMIQFGSTDPNLPASSAIVTNFEDLIGTFKVLFPAVTANGTPISNSNGGIPVASQQGVLAELKPGTQIGQAAQQVLGGSAFCQCEFTRWGFWSIDVTHGVGNLRESIDGFWVAGRQPDVGQVPGQGSATYVGHVAAQIQNGNNDYAASGKFVNTVNFGTRTGQFTITNFDFANYQGVIAFNPNDPRTFGGFGQGTHERNLTLLGSFFRNSSSPVGEMGGTIFVQGNNYLGGGIFIARK